MALRKQRKLIVEKCEAREMLSADGLALPAPAELSEPAAELAYVVAISKLDDKATAIPGDFDADGDCDGDDYLVWQVCWCTGELDGEDWLAWQANYGMNVTAESDIGSNRIDRGDALPHLAGRSFGKQWALATDVAIERWA